MSSERWQRLELLFDQARELSPAERDRFLAGACQGDAALRAEVERLLAAHDRAGAFISTPAVIRLGNAASNDAASEIVGRAFGPYRIVREIARGGMGAVYLAERADGEFERRTALKVIKRGMDTDLVLRRFRAERQILATLDHPNIARLLDGGSTADGRPYFLMEYIEGEPIDEYAESRQLSIRDRLVLFLDVCGAVDYAHRRLVVHRDIKPGNILVTTEGVPKLLDFGIAKVLDPGEDQPTGTITAARIMTPEYASPEQVEGCGATTTSDVYSLGVVLYRLLTGTSPYRVTSRDPLVIAEAVRTTDPAKPSTAVERTTRLRRELRGDLDTIVLMALRKEPERRYRSVAALAADIRRYLEGDPVRARPDTIGYRAGKFMLRNRTPIAVAGIATGIVILAGGLTASRWPMLGAWGRRAGVLASRDRVIVADVVDRAGDSTLATAVSEALRVDLAQSSYVQVLSARQIRSGLARLARSPDVALDDSLARELAVREGVKAFVTGTVSRIAGVYTLTAQVVGAEKGELLAAVRETATDSRDVIPAIGRLSASLRRRMGESLRNVRVTPALEQVTTPSLEALQLYTTANRLTRAGVIDSSRKLFARAVVLDTGFASAYRALANSYGDADQYGRSMAYMEHAIANEQRLPFYERYLTIASYSYGYARDYPRAVAAFEHILGRYPDDVASLNNLGYVYALERNFAKQESLLVRAIRVDSTIKSVHLSLAMAAVNNGDYALARREIDGAAARDPNSVYVRLARIYWSASQQDWDTAERMARARIAAAPHDSSDLPDACETLAGIVMTRGKLAEAERLSREAMSIARATGARGHVMTSALRIALLDLRFRADTAAAVAELERALASNPADSIPEGDRHYDDFARVFAAAGHPTRARKLVSLAGRLRLDRVQKVKPDRHWALGSIALAEGRPIDAVRELRSASATHSCTVCVLPDLARAYDEASQPDSAIVVYEQYLALPWEWRFETDDTEMVPALLRLADLYRQRGDGARAVSTELRLVGLWRDADAEGRRTLSMARAKADHDGA